LPLQKINKQNLNYITYSTGSADIKIYHSNVNLVCHEALTPRTPFSLSFTNCCSKFREKTVEVYNTAEIYFVKEKRAVPWKKFSTSMLI
jgi:hypothetical protein